MAVLAQTKIKDALAEHPELQDVLIGLSPKFKVLRNRGVFNIVSRWATFADVARMGNLSVCEVLHRVNQALGTEDELLAQAPECIVEARQQAPLPTTPPSWLAQASGLILMDVRNREDFFLPSVLETLTSLAEDHVLKVVNAFYPAPLIEMLQQEGYDLYYENPSFHEHTLYIRRTAAPTQGWQAQRHTFPEIDTTAWGKDFLSRLVQTAETLAPGRGFRFTVAAPPASLVNTVESMGLESLVEETENGAYTLYFFKPPTEETAPRTAPGVLRAVPLVIQSATPVVYPILMRLLESRRLMKAIRVEELKVWDKTEKHLGWIVNKKADISFSAVAAVAKLYQKGLDIKMTAIVVWDNFFILTRLPNVKDFADLRGREIHLPLIPAAPPAAVTKFLLQHLGYDPADFHFVFGKPFGRPEEIKAMLVNGQAETALLREPEASFTLHEGQGVIREAIAYRDIWERIFPGQGNLPNAGLLFKGKILREYPDLAAMFQEETAAAAQWVNENPEAAALNIAEIMGVPPAAALRFLQRAHLEYKPSSAVLDDVTHYIDVLNKAGYGGKPFGEIRSLFV